MENKCTHDKNKYLHKRLVHSSKTKVLHSINKNSVCTKFVKYNKSKIKPYFETINVLYALKCTMYGKLEKIKPK